MIGDNAIPADPVAEIHALIDKQRVRRQSNKVLHGHPSPVFWLERKVPVKNLMVERSQSIEKRLNLYVGTPYCLPTNPEHCGFCLFPSETYRNSGQLSEYLRWLRQEARMYEEFFEGTEVASIYFGGGTSNLYKADQYAALVDIVRRLFPRISPGVEVTLEGIPQLFTREKLEAMKAAGINRVSLGVQQLSDELIRASGRKQRRAHVFQALEWCRDLGLPSSVDLIFGWPCQTPDRMLEDLGVLADTGVPHITHYELNVAGRTDFARRRAELPTTEQNLELYRIARDFLTERGYRQVTAYDWERRDASATGYLYEENWRAPFTWDAERGLRGCDAWALGFAGCSFFLGTPEAPGWAYMNAATVPEYVRALDEGRFPITRGFRYTPTDLRLTSLFQMLHGMQVDLAAYRSIFGFDLLEEFTPVWEALVERGWVEVGERTLSVVGDGVFYTPLIQDLLHRDRMAEMRKLKGLASADLQR